MTTKRLMAPDFTAATTLSARARTWLWANPATSFPDSICSGGAHFLAHSITAEKSFFPPAGLSGMCFAPG